MIGRRGAVGLSLLCALAFCAFGAASASAVNGTTAFTCVFEGGKEDFSDAHCDNKVGGKYGHVAIEKDVTTAVHVTNEKTASSTTAHTPAFLKSVAGGIEVTLSCTKVDGKEAWIENKTTVVEGKEKMEVIGGGNVSYTECKATKPVNKEIPPKEVCKVKEPIITNATTETFVNGEEMGVKNKPPAGENFTELVLENNGALKCAIKGTYPITGTMKGTPTNNGAGQKGNGATLHYVTNEQEIKIGVSAAELSQTLTISMAGEPTGNAISLTTT